MSPTIKYFGQFPSCIVMQSSSNFNGTAQTGTPVITPGVYTFPVQAGGGLYNFHEIPIIIRDITYQGGGTLTVSKTFGASSVAQLGQIAGQGTLSLDTELQLSPGETLLFTSSGATNPSIAVTAHEAVYAWMV